MTFKEEATGIFLEFFKSRKQQIRNFPGCHHLELWRDKQHPNVYFTYSHWENEAALDHYRYSEFFKQTWSFTKQHFSAKAEAFSIEQVTVEQ